MRLIGNILWFITGGLIAAAAWSAAGILLTVSIVGIPFGVQCFKIAGFVIWPFGRDVLIGNFGAGGLIFNLFWLAFFGWEFFLIHIIIGVIFCITIVGIPFGMQNFKLAKLGLMPFGAEIT